LEFRQHFRCEKTRFRRQPSDIDCSLIGSVVLIRRRRVTNGRTDRMNCYIAISRFSQICYANAIQKVHSILRQRKQSTALHYTERSRISSLQCEMSWISSVKDEPVEGRRLSTFIPVSRFIGRFHGHLTSVSQIDIRRFHCSTGALRPCATSPLKSRYDRVVSLNQLRPPSRNISRTL